MTAQRSRVAGVHQIGPVESLVGQERQPSRVIDVRVTHQHGVDAPRIERQLGVELPGVGAVALEESGVQQYAGAGGLQQVHRAGDLARGAPERQPDGCRHRVPNRRSPASPRPGRM